MNNNDILRRLRYCFDYSNKKMVKIFDEGGIKASEEQVLLWLLKEEDEGFVLCDDNALAGFLNGFIVVNRGRQEGKAMVAEKRLNKNLILRKIKIACNLTTEDIVEIMQNAGIKTGKSEVTALFRKADHKHYRPCKGQFLRYFLSGLQKKYRS